MGWQNNDDSDLRLLEAKIHGYIDGEIQGVNTTISNLSISGGSTGSGQTPTVYNASPNYIPNSHPEWSLDAWTNAGITPGTAGDDNLECYNWYYITSAATELLTSQPLIADGHTGFAGLNADAPVWDRVNGWFLMGGDTTRYDVCCPLPTDFVFPGQRFYVYMEASVTDAETDENDAEFFIGFWDNTGGQRKWIEGSDFTPTISVFGSPGSRTIAYKILARTDGGTEMLSTEVSVTTAPSTLTDTDHVRLRFTGAPGFIQYVIYRKVGSNYYRVGEVNNSIDLQFFDIVESGSTVVPVSGYPSASTSRPQAYAVTTAFNPAAEGSFSPHTLTVQVPLTYNRSQTGNLQQWLRFGLTGLVASGDARQVAIRRIAVSEGYGGWTRSQLDLQALSGPSSTAASAPGSGLPSGDPPPGGGGGATCLALDTIIETINGDKPIGELEVGDIVLPYNLPVEKIKDGEVQEVFKITLENGLQAVCTDTHRWIRYFGDRKGKPSRALKPGDSILTKTGPSRIVTKESILGGHRVRSIKLPKPHIFIANRMLSHNQKPVDDWLVTGEY